MRPRQSSGSRRRRLLAGFTAGVSAVVLLVGGGAAVAYWTASATATGSASSARVSIAQAGFPTLNKAYVNSTLQAPNTDTLANSGSFTVTNDGAAAGTASVKITGTGALGAALSVRAWPVGATAACGAGAPAGTTESSGTWANTTVGGIALAPGETKKVCVVTSGNRDGAAVASGSNAVTATAQATLTSGGWNAASPTLQSTQTTSAVFPLDRGVVPSSGSRWVMLTRGGTTDKCFDIWDGSMQAGAPIGIWKCFESGATQTNANRVWQLVPDAADRSLVTLRSVNAPDKNIAAQSDGSVKLAQASTTDTRQKWYIQKRDTNGYQLVSAADGRCVNTGTSDSNLTMTECNAGGVAVGISAPVGPSIAGTGASVKVGLGFYRYNINGVAYTAEFRNASNAVVGSCTPINTTTPPGAAMTDEMRLITCSVPDGSYTVTVLGGGQPIYRFSARVGGAGTAITSVIQ